MANCPTASPSGLRLTNCREVEANPSPCMWAPGGLGVALYTQGWLIEVGNGSLCERPSFSRLVPTANLFPASLQTYGMKPADIARTMERW